MPTRTSCDGAPTKLADKKKSLKRRLVAFTSSQISPTGASQETLFSQKAGSYIWNRIPKLSSKPDKPTLELEAYQRLTDLMYHRKYMNASGLGARQKILEIRGIHTVDHHPFTDQILKHKYPSCVDNLYFHNHQTPLSKTISNDTNSNARHFTQIESKDIKFAPPLDLSKYVCTLPCDSNAIKRDINLKSVADTPRFEEIINRTPFFADIADFKKMASDIYVYSYEKRAHFFYVLAEFWSEEFFRATVLYNVELMTYFTELFEGFKIDSKNFTTPDLKNKMQKKIDRLSAVREKLHKGEFGKSGNKNDYESLGLNGLVDADTGLPLDSPILHTHELERLGLHPFQLGGWPFKPKDYQDFKDLSTTTVSQLFELLLSEPVMTTQHPDDPNSKKADIFLWDMYEPICRQEKKSDALTGNTYDVYIQDIQCKLNAALRETRKNMILKMYNKKTIGASFDSESFATRIDTTIAKRRDGEDPGAAGLTALEDRVDLLWVEEVVPAVKSLNARVTTNLIAAKKHFEDKKSTTDRYSTPSDIWLTGIDMMTPYVTTPSFSVPSASYSLLARSGVSGSQRVPL